jgi:hypothetical protein
MLKPEVVERGMSLKSGGSISKRDVTREDIEAAFENDDARGEILLLGHSTDGNYRAPAPPAASTQILL